MSARGDQSSALLGCAETNSSKMLRTGPGRQQGAARGRGCSTSPPVLGVLPRTPELVPREAGDGHTPSCPPR